jgi:hypothetical protein
MSWLARCRDQLVSRIHEFFLLWFEAYGRISPLPLSNFPETEHEEVRLSPPRLVDEDTYPPPSSRDRPLWQAPDHRSRRHTITGGHTQISRQNTLVAQSLAPRILQYPVKKKGRPRMGGPSLGRTP